MTHICLFSLLALFPDPSDAPAAAKSTNAPPAVRVLPAGEQPDDARLGALKDLDGYFPFEPSESPEAWEERAATVRRQMLVAMGLWPMPPRPPIEATVHGTVERDGYTVSRVFFESSPGLYVTGSLYRPANKAEQGKRPAILCPHGHWSNGRFHSHGEAQVKQEIERGAERFEDGGRHPLQARCVQLARMGCLVFHYDMLGYADSVPITFQVAHRFGKQREHLNRPMRWGLFSPQAELRSVSVMGLQTWNSIRALDWILSLPEVDKDRIGVTGASGGGTQSFMLAALDERVRAAFPAVMVSTAMQGGCTCENACYLRIDTGNIEFAALCAPRPLGLTAANDWTKELETKGLPELKRHYEMLGVGNRVEGKYFPFSHNYNAVSRQMMYEFFNEHFQLGFDSPIQEQDYEPLTTEELTVWNEEHPKPEATEDAEVAAIKAWYELARQPIEKVSPPENKDELEAFRKMAGGAYAVMIGRGLPAADEVEHEVVGPIEYPDADYRAIKLLVRHKPSDSELPVVAVTPKDSKDWNHRVVVLAHGEGKAAWFDEQGQPAAAVRELAEAGFVVLTADLLHQGEFLPGGKPLEEAPRVKNTREFAGYTLGYNHPLFAQRVHDLLTLIAHASDPELEPESVALVGVGGAGPWAAAAAAVAGDAIDSLAIDTEGFRFDEITDIRDPNLLPGAVKFGDLPGLLALVETERLWLAGEGRKVPEPAASAYRAAGTADRVTSVRAKTEDVLPQIAKWLTNGK